MLGPDASSANFRRDGRAGAFDFISSWAAHHAAQRVHAHLLNQPVNGRGQGLLAVELLGLREVLGGGQEFVFCVGEFRRCSASAAASFSRVALIRVGSDEYAKQNGSYGLTTLKNGHGQVEGLALRFNSRARAAKYGGSAFATGVSLAALALRELATFDNQSGAKRNIKATIQRVAVRLGNTATICRKCYVHPEILTTYIKGSLLLEVKDRADVELAGLPGLEPGEAAVLALLHARLRGHVVPALYLSLSPSAWIGRCV